MEKEKSEKGGIFRYDKEKDEIVLDLNRKNGDN